MSTEAAQAGPSVGNGHGVDLSQPTLVADEVAELWGVSLWTLYEHVRRGDLPPELEPIRIGRCLRWPTQRVVAALGLAQEPI